MSWKIKDDLKQKIADEWGVEVYQPGLRHPVAFVYPNVYHLGMSNLGMHILYQMINARGDSACERFFLPESKMRKSPPWKFAAICNRYSEGFGKQ